MKSKPSETDIRSFTLTDRDRLALDCLKLQTSLYPETEDGEHYLLQMGEAEGCQDAAKAAYTLADMMIHQSFESTNSPPYPKLRGV